MTDGGYWERLRRDMGVGGSGPIGNAFRAATRRPILAREVEPGVYCITTMTSRTRPAE